MKERLIAALAQLDSSNANHWTAENLPRLETVRILVGDQTITRQAINDIAPVYTRENRVLGQVATAPTVALADTGIPSISMALSDIPVSDEPTIAEKILILNERIQERKLQLDEIRNEVDEMQTIRDKYVMIQEANEPTASLPAQVKNYHERQLEVRQNRSAVRTQLSSSGVNLRELAKLTQGAPIDTVRQRR